MDADADSHKPLRWPFAGLFVISSAIAAAAGALLAPPAVMFSLMQEGGPIEYATAVLYFVAAASAYAFVARKKAWRTWLPLGLVLTAFGARELDLHKAFGKSLLRASFYFGDAPVEQKVVGGLVLLLVAASLLALVRQARPTLRRRKYDPAAGTAVVFAATLVATKILDRSINLVVEKFSVHVDVTSQILVLSLEESLELCLPLLALLGLAQASRRFINIRQATEAPAIARAATAGRPHPDGRLRPYPIGPFPIARYCLVAEPGEFVVSVPGAIWDFTAPGEPSDRVDSDAAPVAVLPLAPDVPVAVESPRAGPPGEVCEPMAPGADCD